MSEASNPQHESHNDGSHYQPSLLVVFIILILFIGTTFAMLRSTNAGSPSVTTTTPASTSGTTTTTVHIEAKSKVRVQVANGTLTTGLARTYTQQLMTYGWDTLPELNGPRVAATTIYYNPGFIWAARQLAGEIKVSGSAIQPLNGLRPVSGASGDDVIIVLGPDVAIKG
jgi:hypothetical protein